MLWLNILCKCSNVICDIIYVYKHGSFNKRWQNLIKSLRLEKGWSMLRMTREFRSWKWKSTLCNLITRVDETGTIDRQNGSSGPRSARTTINIQAVGDLICSQNCPGTSKSPREIECKTGISRSSICHIVKKDLHLCINDRCCFIVRWVKIR